MTWRDCSRVCIGLCPCPEPRWLWNCYRESVALESVDPQVRLTPGYFRSLPYHVWNGDYS